MIGATRSLAGFLVPLAQRRSKVLQAPEPFSRPVCRSLGRIAVNGAKAKTEWVEIQQQLCTAT